MLDDENLNSNIFNALLEYVHVVKDATTDPQATADWWTQCPN